MLAETLGVVLIAAATFRYWLLYFNRGSNLLDEGSQAAQALRILNGDLIYRDFVTRGHGQAPTTPWRGSFGFSGPTSSFSVGLRSPLASGS